MYARGGGGGSPTGGGGGGGMRAVLKGVGGVHTKYMYGSCYELLKLSW